MEEQLGQLIEQVLGKWGGQRRESDAIRDDMVRVALWTGISKHRIYVLTGIARTTIDRIAAVTRVPSGSSKTTRRAKMAPEVNPDPFAALRGVSLEEAARNWEANAAALREALGMRTMQEFGEEVQAGMRKINEQWPAGRMLAAGVDAYNQRMAEINKGSQDDTQGQ
jgi:hypothetical protein